MNNKNNKKKQTKKIPNLVCRLKPERPRLRINSEDIDTGPPNANQNIKNIQNSSANNNTCKPSSIATTITTTTLNNRTQSMINNTEIVPVAVAARDTANAAKSLASYCQYDSVDLDNLETIDIATTNPFSGSATSPSKILENCDLKYDTTAITSI